MEKTQDELSETRSVLINIINMSVSSMTRTGEEQMRIPWVMDLIGGVY